MLFRASRTALALFGAAALLSVANGHPGAADTQVKIAVAGFNFVDTSGEATDQRTQHAARLQAFGDELRSALSATGRYAVVALPCDEATCSDDAALRDRARAEGAALLMLGVIQKMSTLIENGRVAVVDLRTDRLAYGRMFSFRGDTDEAWHRAAHFIAESVAQPAAIKTDDGK
jgi:hypothetical protein